MHDDLHPMTAEQHYGEARAALAAAEELSVNTPTTATAYALTGIGHALMALDRGVAKLEPADPITARETSGYWPVVVLLLGMAAMLLGTVAVLVR